MVLAVIKSAASSLPEDQVPGDPGIRVNIICLTLKRIKKRVKTQNVGSGVIGMAFRVKTCQNVSKLYQNKVLTL